MRALRLFLLGALISVLLVEAGAQTRGAATPTYGYQVVKTYPHDRNSFTQGLLFIDGTLYESNGKNGSSNSTLRRIPASKSTRVGFCVTMESPITSASIPVFTNV